MIAMKTFIPAMKRILETLGDKVEKALAPRRPAPVPIPVRVRDY